MSTTENPQGFDSERSDFEDAELCNIWTPIEISGSVLRNRIVCSPISVNMANADGTVTPEVVNFYSLMARTGVGMVTIGATAVSPEGGSTDHGLHVGPSHFEPGLRRLARSVKSTGALASLQIFHVGAQGNTYYTGQPVVGPSTYICPDIGIPARELTISEIEKLEDQFVNAILSGLRCGFDFVELHVAHGYLLHEFISPFFNRRCDEYGGDEIGRFRIIYNIIDKLNTRDSGAMRSVGARISGGDFVSAGMNIESNRPLINLFDRNRSAYWVVSAGIYETAKQKYIHMKRGDYWNYAAELKAITDTPVIAQGGIRDLNVGEKILRLGMSDMVGMAQALIADSGLIKKTSEKRQIDVVACVECGRCRYVKRKDLTFACVLPTSDFYQPNLEHTLNNENIEHAE